MRFRKSRVVARNKNKIMCKLAEVKLKRDESKPQYQYSRKMFGSPGRYFPIVSASNLFDHKIFFATNLPKKETVDIMNSTISSDVSDSILES